MSVRRLTALGTASQVPTRYRNHNGYLMEWDGEGVLFDPGEGTQRQMLFAGVASTRIHHICITHFHGDHCLGLAGVIQRLSLDKVTRPVHVYFPASGQVYFERLRKASIFHDLTNLVPVPVSREGTIYQGAGYRIEAAALDHGVPCWGYRIVEADDVRMLPEQLRRHGVRGPAVGKLKKDGVVTVGARRVTLDMVSTIRRGQTMAFVMDTRDCAGARALARDADLLVCESTYLASEAEEAHAHGHLTARGAAEMARDAGARRLVLTHFSQRYPSLEPFIAEAGAVFPHVTAVCDGDVVDMPTRAETDAAAAAG